MMAKPNSPDLEKSFHLQGPGRKVFCCPGSQMDIFVVIFGFPLNEHLLFSLWLLKPSPHFIMIQRCPKCIEGP